MEELHAKTSEFDTTCLRLNFIIVHFTVIVNCPREAKRKSVERDNDMLSSSNLSSGSRTKKKHAEIEMGDDRVSITCW